MRIIVLTLAVGSLVFSSCLQEQCEEAVRKIDSKIQFHGIVADCFFNESGRGIPTLVLSNKKFFKTHAYTLCCYVNPGDSIWKSKESLKYFVKRGDSVSIFYPECGKTQVRDSGRTHYNPDFTMECDKRRDTKKAPLEIEL